MTSSDSTTEHTANTTNRPLSPHLTIYKPQLTSMMSISHRITGAFLAAGLVVWVAWLWAAAYSPECFATLKEWSQHTVAKAALWAWVFAFYYHLLNGIRHLLWDMGKCLTLPAVYRTGVLVLLGSAALTAFTWHILCSGTCPIMGAGS